MDHFNITAGNRTLDLETDYFSGLYENRLSKWIFIVAIILLLPINIFLLYSVTWYDVFSTFSCVGDISLVSFPMDFYGFSDMWCN